MALSERSVAVVTAQVCPECGHGEPHVRRPSNFCGAVERDAGGSLVYCGCRYVFPFDGDLPCRCRGCGRLYRVDIQVTTEDLWKQIADSPTMLCGICIIERIELLNKHAHYDLVEGKVKGGIRR